MKTLNEIFNTNSKPIKTVLIASMLLFIFFYIVKTNKSPNSIQNHYDQGKIYYESKDYFHASIEFKSVPINNKKYKEAQKMLLSSDSLFNIERIENQKRNDNLNKLAAIALKKWYNTKPGKIQKRHPDWSNEDCERIANNEIWIGMTIDMLKYERGLPNKVNVSNYGNGNQYQYVWDDINPCCFYCKGDGIITAFN